MADASDQSSDSLPAFSLKGDAVLVLDSGSEFIVHSAFLELRSEVLAAAVSLAAAEKHGSNKMHLSLPAVSDAAAQLLVSIAYSQEPETLLHMLAISQLFELAYMAHRYAMSGLFSMVDKACLICMYRLHALGFSL